MNWFYAEAGQQKGPVSDEELERLAREGAITPATLVWHEGMADWQSLASTRPASSLPPLVSPPAQNILAPGEVICAECNKAVPVGDTVQFGALRVCSACKPAYVQKLREGAVAFTSEAPPSMHYAGFWIRVAAYVIDQMIMGVLGLPLTFWFMQRMQQALQGGRINWESYLANYGLLSGVSLLLSLLYAVIFVGRWAATPGKMILKIKVVTATGQKVSYLRALARFGGNFVSSLPCMVGYLVPIWDHEKRALHDMICNTRVVYK